MKEIGSFFHEFDDLRSSRSDTFFECEDYTLTYSGRVALYKILEWGIQKQMWQEVQFPSYYCHEVVDFCRKLPLRVSYYEYNPFDPESVKWTDDKRIAIIKVDYFGLGGCDTSVIKEASVIEDLSNNLISLNASKADFVFASLRKQLPLPVGGLMRVKGDQISLSSDCIDLAQLNAERKHTSMSLKLLYLKGLYKHKRCFRALYNDSEEFLKNSGSIGPMPSFVKDNFEGLPVSELLTSTKENISYALKNITNSERIKVLRSEHHSNMGILLVCATHCLRERLKDYLLDKNIYPAILWPNQKYPSDKYYEKRILFLHADFRYTKADIDLLVFHLNTFISNVEI